MNDRIVAGRDESSTTYDCCCKFDPKLVGVPRKDWPPEEK